MPELNPYTIPEELVLGVEYKKNIPDADQKRQRTEVHAILRRLSGQPGVILADEVGMGKTFVALGVAYSVASQSRRGPAVVMAPPNLIDKWVQDLETFFELYVKGPKPVPRDGPKAAPRAPRSRHAFRYGVARHSIELMKLLDDKPSVRCHLIFLGQGAMARRQTDKWVRLALIREALRRHGRGNSRRLIKVKKVIHRFMADLLHAVGEQSASGWGEKLWQNLLKSDPETWKDIYNDKIRGERDKLNDDPVPRAVVSALNKGRIDLKLLAKALEAMPLRSMSSQSDRQRINTARKTLREVEEEVWKELLAKAKWLSPLLVMDEAHHLKNPATNLARQLQSRETNDDLRTGDGAMAKAFDRMLFLTATPFQLGHKELVHVLERFGDVNWDNKIFLEREKFRENLEELNDRLTQSQREAIRLQKCWSRLGPGDGPSNGDPDQWWRSLGARPPDQRTRRQHALCQAYARARELRAEAEDRLKPWIIRHNKGEHWPGTQVARRRRVEGAAIRDGGRKLAGLEVRPSQLLPFFLAARSAASPSRELLGEALCSSYEAFRHTRERGMAERDEYQQDEKHINPAHSDWYLSEFDKALKESTGEIHPKIEVTVRRAVELWEDGEKVLIFAFYRQTCRALRIHISAAIERRMKEGCFADAGKPLPNDDIEQAVESIQRRYMDDVKSPARRELDRSLEAVINDARGRVEITQDQRERLVDIMRRFLRVKTTLYRCFPIHAHDTLEPGAAVRIMLDKEDGSGLSWREKFAGFVDFLIDRCSVAERDAYLEAATRTQTGSIRVGIGEFGDDTENEAGESDAVVTLANVQVATGQTKRESRSRLMRAFNTPFFPDILVCSEVMGEGVDLQRHCRYVIHHDLAWNPSQIEQRTGRIDRLGCKAEGRHPIHLYLPYLDGAADERQYRVMSEREQWFRIVMGQDEVAKLIPSDAAGERPSLPFDFSEGLSFNLGLG